jgi:hypothetical protein
MKAMATQMFVMLIDMAIGLIVAQVITEIISQRLLRALSIFK